MVSSSSSSSSAAAADRSRIEVGEKYLVYWKNGDKVPAEIIERRLIKKYRDVNIDNKKLTYSDYEYYIHFINYDRRMDEWVSSDRVDTQGPITSSNSLGLPANFEHDSYHTSHSHHTSTASYKRKKRMDDNGVGTTAVDEKESMLAMLEKEHDEITKVKNIQSIIMGKYKIETWYFSPYPDECCGGEHMLLCEFCLKYMKTEKTLVSHSKKCLMKSPPGREVYRENDLSLFEVDGQDHKIYCQNLCLLSKLFLDHKTLYYDVDPFLFYILCEFDEEGYHIVGYFSKEKHSRENYNLACILTFPPYQRKGYGKFLISLSYELSKREQTTGSPEKPLSDLGKISYRSYWQFVILKVLRELDNNIQSINIVEIGRRTGIKAEDVISTLHYLDMIKNWKGKHVITYNPALIAKLMSREKHIRLCDPACLAWQPPNKSAK